MCESANFSPFYLKKSPPSDLLVIKIRNVFRERSHEIEEVNNRRNGNETSYQYYGKKGLLNRKTDDVPSDQIVAVDLLCAELRLI